MLLFRPGMWVLFEDALLARWKRRETSWKSGENGGNEWFKQNTPKTIGLFLPY